MMASVRKVGKWAWAMLLLAACSKELSVESGGSAPDPTGGTSQGTLAGAPGACAPIEVLGLYPQDILLDTSNKVVVEMNFTAAGSYYISTDTVNGVWFNASGAVPAAGAAKLTLKAFGAGLNPGQYTYTVKFKGSQCSFVVPFYQSVIVPDGGDYFPMTVGSNWTYVTSDPGGAPSDTLRQVATSETMSAGGQTYTRFIGLSGPFRDSTYYRKTSGQYFQYTDLDLFGLANDPVPGEYNFLRDNVPVGTVWYSAEQNAVSGTTPFTFRLKMELTGRGARTLIGTKIYLNVIKVRTTQQVKTTTGGWLDAFTVEYRFARQIGMLGVFLDLPLYGYELQRYQVN